MFWLIVVFLGVGIAWYFLKRKRPDIEKSKMPQKPESKPIWGKCLVTRPEGSACSAAKAISGKCFDLNEIPVLPLSDCTRKADCMCYFKPLPERRILEDRRSGKERRPSVRYDLTSQPRRSGKDRRYKNHDPFNTIDGGKNR